MAQINVQSLFTDLQRLGQQRDFDKALRVANKILQANADDEKAFHCKVVCLIQLGKFEDALTAIRKTQALSSNLMFEKGYCEYRLNRTSEAYRTLTSVANPDHRIKELLAQVQYRMEEYEQCYKVYRDLLKNTTDDFQTERETNLSAVIASLQMWGDGNLDEFGLNEDVYEICYNHGCFLLGRGMYTEALKKLKQAEDMCKKFFEEDPDATEEDVESELGVIRVQQGFALQKLKRNEEAMAIYNQILKQRPSEAALLAVLSNNVVSLNKDQNVFDSKKKMKAATVGGLQQKLTSQQRETIALNQCLLYMYSNQSDQCKRTADALQKTYPNNDTPVLIHAAQLNKDKQYNQAVELLKTHLSSSTGNAFAVRLSLAQLYLSQNHLYQACDVLRALGDLTYKPGLVSAVVSLYTAQEDRTAAADFLQEATEWHTDRDPKSSDCLLMVRACANYHLRYGDPKVAAEMLERLCKKNPGDNKALAQLISAYSKFDPVKAQEVSRRLPSPKELASDVDVEALENSLTSFSQKYKKQSKAESSPKSPTSPKSAGKSSDQMLEKSKKKKKKKGKLPKNLDPNAVIDPERWLPLKERSYYKGKRKRKGRSDVGKGTQGSVPASLMAELDASKSSPSVSGGTESPRGAASASASATSQQPQGPRQQNPKGAKNKKKKGKGGKW